MGTLKEELRRAYTDPKGFLAERQEKEKADRIDRMVEWTMMCNSVNDLTSEEREKLEADLKEAAKDPKGFLERRRKERQNG